MNKEEKIQLAKAVQVMNRKKAQDDYYSYVKYTHEIFVELPHIKYICSKINKMIENRQDMLSGVIPIKNQYIMISLPPRHSKSMSITETLPSYFMGKFPASKVIMTAYSITLADDFARANANKIEEYKVFNNVVLSNNQDRMVLDNKSICVKAGIMGGITGKGAHLLIIDDPIKTQEEASSETTRNKIWKEWVASLSTRLEEAAIIILIMTRWHEDDLCGRLLNKEYGDPLPWDVVNVPLEAESDDILGRTPGEPLWDRYGLDFIRERKQYPQTFNALYQGRPTAEEGNMIKRNWWKYYDAMPVRFDQIIQSWDCTFKESTGSDYVVGQVWGRVGPDKYLLDLVRERMDLPSTITEILLMTSKWPKAHAKLIEDKANGPAVMQMLQHKIPGMIAINPRGSKIARVQAVLPHIESGNVYLPLHQTWTKQFVEECSSFPNGKHDDMVDAMSQALDRLILDYSTLNSRSPIDNINRFVTKKTTGGHVQW